MILISLDTLRADHLGLYGYARETAPRLAELGRESVVFNTVAAQAAQTLVSHKSLFASRYPLRLIREATNVSWDELISMKRRGRFVIDALKSSRVSLVDDLRRAGFQTLGFTDGGWMSTSMGFDEGFVGYDDQGGRLATILPRLRKRLDNLWSDADAPPLFLFLHAYDIHCPYHSRNPYDTLFCENHGEHLDLRERCAKPHFLSMSLTAKDFEAISNHYDGGIASADAYVGEFIDYLKGRGRYDEALIVVMSDHGDSLGERGLVGHGGLYLEQLLVPLIVKPPRSWNVAPGRIEGAVELVDVMPTLLDAAAVDPTPNLDGRSLLPVIRGTAASSRRFLVAQTTFREGHPAVTTLAKRAVLEPGRWLLIHDATSNTHQLFDLTEDPHGLAPKAGAAERTGGLMAVMAARDGPGNFSGSALREPPTPERAEDLHDPKLMEELRALGYVD